MSSEQPARDAGGSARPRASTDRNSLEPFPALPQEAAAPRRAATWDDDGLQPPRPSNDVEGAGARRRAGTTSSLRPPSMTGSLRQRNATRSSANPRRSTVNARSNMNAIATGYTLAGSDGAPPGTHTAYVDPGYVDLNPAYEQPNNTRPVWGLAKPMPRVLRPGMVPTQAEINQAMQNQASVQQAGQMSSDLEKGNVGPADAIRRPGATLNRVRSQRRQTLSERFAPGNNLILSQTPSQMSSRRRRRGWSQNQPDLALETFDEADEDDITPETTEATIPEDPPVPLGLTEHPTGDPEAWGEDANSEVTQIDDEGEQEWAELKRYNGLEDEIHNNHTTWSVIRTHYREPFAEFLGVFCQLIIGFSVDLQNTVGGNKYGAAGDFGWGAATMIGIYVAGGISGGHLNPAVTIMLWMYRGFPRKKMLGYFFAQLLGGFVAGLIVYGIYKDGIMNYTGGSPVSGPNSTIAQQFITSLRHPWISPLTGFWNEFLGATILGIIILAVGDDKNAPPGPGMAPLIFAFIVFSTSAAFSYNTGAALNPTRDLGPRLALFAVGFGPGLWTNGYFAYGPIAAPIAGMLFGGAMYDALIFTGGESPINYPLQNFHRSMLKFRRRWMYRLRGLEVPQTFKR